MLVLEQLLEELDVGALLLDRLLVADLERLEDPGEPKALELRQELVGGLHGSMTLLFTVSAAGQFRWMGLSSAVERAKIAVFGTGPASAVGSSGSPARSIPLTRIILTV